MTKTQATSSPARHFDRVKTSVLLYLETCCVDRDGRVDMRRINGEDKAAIDQMVEDGLITFGRIRAADVTETGSHSVFLTDEAWKWAHSFRKARADNAMLKRSYTTTAELRAAKVDDDPSDGGSAPHTLVGAEPL